MEKILNRTYLGSEYLYTYICKQCCYRNYLLYSRLSGYCWTAIVSIAFYLNFDILLWPFCYPLSTLALFYFRKVFSEFLEVISSYSYSISFSNIHIIKTDRKAINRQILSINVQKIICHCMLIFFVVKRISFLLFLIILYCVFINFMLLFVINCWSCIPKIIGL